MSVVIVTGGCGFIGGHLVDTLVKLNHDVVVVDDGSANSHVAIEHNRGATYYSEDITDISAIDWIFDGADYVFHLAAESRIQPAILNPSLAYRTNVLGTLNVLELSKKYNIKRVMYSSTSSVYGLTTQFPTDEKCGIDCLNPYSHSKFLGEELVRRYWDQYGLDSVIFRYFNVFGERSPTTGPYAPVVGIFLDQFKRGVPLTIVGDGSRKRDFIHVSDVVAVNIAAMNTGKVGACTYNIGSRSCISIQEIADLISTNQIYISDRLGEADNTLADNNLACNEFCWEPKVSIRNWINAINT
jgi:UDP-glucose 4-epimerase